MTAPSAIDSWGEQLRALGTLSRPVWSTEREQLP